MIVGYVLAGLSEEKRAAKKRAAAAAEAERLRARLERVEEQLEKKEALRKARMNKEVFYARNELDRVKLSLSEDPYKNRQVFERNQRNRSRVGDLAFRYPAVGDEARESCTKAMINRDSIKGGDQVNKDLGFGRPQGEFSTFLKQQIRLGEKGGKRQQLPSF